MPFSLHLSPILQQDFLVKNLRTVALAMTCLALPALHAAANAQNSKPNIVLIMADDVGLGDLSYYHTRRTSDPPVVRTPNLDRLAADGMRFSDAHSPASLCAPTRFSMMTGVYSFRNGQPYGVWSPSANSRIEPNYTTIARIAKAGGYRTAFFGKWGLGGVWNRRDADFSRISHGARYFGFDYALELPQGIQDPPFAFYENQAFMPMDPGAGMAKIDADQTRYSLARKHKDKGGWGDASWDPRRSGPILARKAVDYIDRQAAKANGQPFFMYYCTQAVHIPHTPPDELNGQRVAGTTAGDHGDMIFELDLQVGMIIDALKTHGLYDNTLFVFTSDNGGLGYTQYMRKAGHDTSNGLRGSKGSVYEGGHRIPFIATWPNRIAPNTESDVPIVGMDMVATVAALAEQPLDRSVVRDSMDLVSILTGETDRTPDRVLVHQSGSGDPHFGLRDGRWKLIVAGGSRDQFGPVAPVALFDLDTNVNEVETENLINDPEHQTRIKQMLERYLELRMEDGETIRGE